MKNKRKKKHQKTSPGGISKDRSKVGLVLRIEYLY